SLAIKILVGFAVTNYLGKTQNGILNYPMAFAIYFIAAAALGLDSLITRELLKKPNDKNTLLGSAFVLKLIGGITILPLIYFAYTLLSTVKNIETPLNYILIVGFIGVIQSFNIIDGYFQSKVEGKKIMLVQVVGNLLSAAIKLVFIFLDLPLQWFIIALTVDAALLALGYVFLYQQNENSILNWKFESKTAKYLLKNAWSLAFAAILVSIYMKIDQIMVESYLGTDALGIYSTVVSLSESWYFIPVAIVTSIFPALMNAKREDPERYQKRLQNLYDLMVWLSVSVALVMTFLSPWLYALVYKAEFASGASVLSVHIWAGVFVFLGSASGQFLIAEGYTKIAMLRTGMGALTNILLNIIWIPKYGIMGAALATLAAYFVATFFIILIPKTRKQGIMMLKSLFLLTAIQKIYKH
ncbi:MAG: flippase, partial [Sphingobacteriaceae bacterium]|nr:flippase [Sphingobacteriaceae bacterium]